MPETARIYSRLYRALLSAGILLLLSWHHAFALPPQHFVIQPPAIETRTGSIVVRLGISVDNVDGLYEMLKDGASFQLVVDAKLERVRTFWTNVLLSEKQQVSILRHNPLTREFMLYMPGEEKPLLDKNLERLLAATWHKYQVNVGPVGLLRQAEAGSAYQILLNIALRHAEVPPWLAKNYVLWSWNVVDPVNITLPFHFMDTGR